MRKCVFKGSGVALVTPMNDDFSVNFDMLKILIEHQIKKHSDAIVITGTTGEGSTLTDEEQMDIIRFTVQYTNHRVPVIAGTGSNSTVHAVELAKRAESVGADALLQVTPYYNKCSQMGLVKHFGCVSRSVSVPIIVYNIPSRTGVNILPQTYRMLCENDNIVGVKEASGDLSQIARIISLCNDRLDIYSGNDDQITSALALGAKGVISVLANILPQVTHDICENYFHHKTEVGDELHQNYLELINALFLDVNPIPVKHAMNAMGLEVGPCRLPLCEMEPSMAEELIQVLNKYKLQAAILHERRSMYYGSI